MHLDQAQILLRGKPLARFGRKRRRGDGLDKQLGNLLGRGAIDLAIDADDAAKR